LAPAIGPYRVSPRTHSEIDEEHGALEIAALFLVAESVSAESSTKDPVGTAAEPGTNTSFGSLKQIDAGVLNFGYADGPR